MRSAVVRLDRAADPDVDLVVLPGAGEPVSRFRSWLPWLPDHVGLVGIERAGRGVRLDERPEPRLGALAAGIVAELGALHRPVVLVGHSAGSLIAHAVAHTVRRSRATVGHPPVLGVVALNGRSPTVDEHLAWLDLDDDRLAAEIVRLRTELAPMLARPDVRELFLPGLRADLELYRRTPAERYPPICVPVVAVGGRDDPLVPPAHLWRWREATAAAFIGRVRPGRHFSLVDEPDEGLPEVLALIDRHLLHGGVGSGVKVRGRRWSG